MDNNAADRALRGLGRGPNHCGSKLKRGIQIAALFYSLYETGKLCDVIPSLYVKAVAEQALQ